MACRQAGIAPGEQFDLSALRAVGSTGAPLPPDGFRWVYEAVAPDVMLSSISGGTDVCSAFVGGCPMVPVWRARSRAAISAAAVAAFDEDGPPGGGRAGRARDHQADAVDAGRLLGRRRRLAVPRRLLRALIPACGATATGSRSPTDGSCVITGRSDATLNRGGVRIGTSEIYRVVEAVDGVVDSLSCTSKPPTQAAGHARVVRRRSPAASSSTRLAIAHPRAIRRDLSPRHVPDEVMHVPSIPTTLCGKKLELPVKKILLGADPESSPAAAP